VSALPAEAWSGVTAPDQVRLLADYSRLTGHRLVLDYSTPDKDSVRRVTVLDVKDEPPALGVEAIPYLTTVEWPVLAFRTFLLERVTRARLDG
jgi:hypothetical protein